MYITEVLLSRLDILLGFVLGLSGTIFVDYRRKREKRKVFREGSRTELTRILVEINLLSLNEHCNITEDKARTWLALCKEFDLLKVALPSVDHRVFDAAKKVDLTNEDIVGFVKQHNATRTKRLESGNYLAFGKLNYSFIQNNISSLSLLPKEEQTRLLSIISRLDLINQEISRLLFIAEKSYDSSVTESSNNRLKRDYRSGCQALSDISYIIAIEISQLLRLLLV